MVTRTRILISIFLSFTIFFSAFAPAIAEVTIPITNQDVKKNLVDKSGKDNVLTPPGLDKIEIIHYDKKFAKPLKPGGSQKDSPCYSFIGKGLSWKSLPIDYTIQTGNAPVSLDMDAIIFGAEEWDNEVVNNELFNSPTINGESQTVSIQNNINEMFFGNYQVSGVIAVTTIWGYFYGPISNREIIEFDILFDTDYNWGNASSDSTLMDLQNIATHEIGHGLGLNDQYDSTCSLETMYGYSSNGDIVKRDLFTGDIQGITKLYGD